jgi:hypothetical protein
MSIEPEQTESADEKSAKEWAAFYLGVGYKNPAHALQRIEIKKVNGGNWQAVVPISVTPEMVARATHGVEAGNYLLLREFASREKARDFKRQVSESVRAHIRWVETEKESLDKAALAGDAALDAAKAALAAEDAALDAAIAEGQADFDIEAEIKAEDAAAAAMGKTPSGLHNWPGL